MIPFQSHTDKRLRYYLYISDAKLDMLSEQIGRRALKQISAEVKVDIKLASVTLHGAENASDSRIAKLRVVEKYIYSNHDIGSVQEPGCEYFRGQMDMQWGFPSRGHILGQAVCFVGHDVTSSRLICLAGSRRHVFGEAPAITVESFSVSPHVTSALRQLLDDPVSEDRDSRDVMRVIRKIFDPRRGLLSAEPMQRMEFLAICLAEAEVGDANPVHVVLGTPLYVSRGSAT